MTERERVRQHFLDLPKTHRWPSASERPGNWYVRLDDAVAAVLAASPSVEPAGMAEALDAALRDMTGAYHHERSHAGSWDQCQRPRCQNARLALEGRGPFANIAACGDDSWDRRYACVKPAGHPTPGPGLTDHDYQIKRAALLPTQASDSPDDTEGAG